MTRAILNVVGYVIGIGIVTCGVFLLLAPLFAILIPQWEPDLLTEGLDLKTQEGQKQLFYRQVMTFVVTCIIWLPCFLLYLHFGHDLSWHQIFVGGKG